MDNLPCIDIEGKQLAYTNSEVKRLTDTDGCHLNLVTDKVHSMDDDLQSNSEDEDVACHLTDDIADTKLERVRREYMSVFLQMDRLGKRPKIRQDQLDGEVSLRDTIQEIIDTEGADSSINKMYEHLGKIDDKLERDKNKFIEVAPKTVYKNRIVIGEQIPINQESYVVFNFALWREGLNEPFDSSWARQKPATVNMSSDPLLPGLYDLLLTMKKGEWSEAIIRPEAAFGRLGAMPRIPPNATLFALVQIINVVSKDKLPIRFQEDSNEIDANVMDFKSLKEMSEEARKQGVRMLEGFTYKDEIEERSGQELLVHLYNNIASTANKSGNPRLALKACKEVISLNGGNEKTYYNKMIAWKRKGHLDRALMVARRAMQLFHEDPKKHKVFRDEADRMKRLIAQEQSDLNKLYRLMGSAYGAPKSRI